MRVELVNLLLECGIHHPTSFLRLESQCDGGIRIDVTGYPWWQGNPPLDSRDSITFYIEGVSEGHLGNEVFDADSFEEDLETFDVRPLSDHAWAKGSNCDVYCNRPLSNPLDLYVGLHDFLLSVGCPYGSERYLNMGDSGSLKEFVAIASSKSFLLYRGPEAVCQVVCEKLKTSGADFNVLKGADFSSDLICVQLSGSYLICESAYAIFEG